MKLQLVQSSVSDIILIFSLPWTCYLFMLFFWFSMKVLHSLFEIPLSKHSYHTKTSLPIYNTNQLPSFHMKQSLLRGISEQTFPNKYCAKTFTWFSDFKYYLLIDHGFVFTWSISTRIYPIPSFNGFWAEWISKCGITCSIEQYFWFWAAFRSKWFKSVAF